jgi:predicted permease
MGRLRPDWTVARASAHLNAISPAIFEATVPPGYRRESDDIYRGLRLAATAAGNGSSRLRESYDAALWLLLAMTGIVLLVACVNLANLMLARAAARQRDIAIRIALGATRRRVLFQFLAEGLALSIVGGAIGLLLSSGLSRGLLSLLNTEAYPILIDIGADWRVLTFSSAVAVTTCLVFAVIPALRTLRGQPLAAIRDGGRGATRGRESFSIHRLLVASQIALSLILLAGALLFVRSFRNLATLDAGFHRHGIVFAAINFAGRDIPPNARSAFRQQLLDEVRSTPGVASAALTTYIPLANSSWSLAIRVPGPSGEKAGGSRFTYVSPRYFETMGIRLLAGRDFNDFDRADTRTVAIVNETFVKRYLGTANPVGAQMRTVGEPGSPPTPYEIIGVVSDTKYGNLRDATPAMTFVPITQNPDRRPMAFIAVRSAGNQDATVSDLRNRFRSAHPELPARFQVFERQVQDGLSRERLMAWLAAFFGAVAATLVVIGLYGLLSYIVQRRTNEIGIRVALGATRSSIGRLVLGQTLGLVVAGLAIGIPVSIVAARSAGSLLFGVSPTDMPTLIAAAGLLATIAICASLAPAWHAARVDPIRALRAE